MVAPTKVANVNTESQTEASLINDGIFTAEILQKDELLKRNSKIQIDFGILPHNCLIAK